MDVITDNLEFTDKQHSSNALNSTNNNSAKLDNENEDEKKKRLIKEKFKALLSRKEKSRSLFESLHNAFLRHKWIAITIFKAKIYA
jgi:Fe2+ transport system protein B